MKKKIEKAAMKLFDESCSSGLNLSYKSVLESMYETAIKNKMFFNADIIQDLIIEEINS